MGLLEKLLALAKARLNFTRGLAAAVLILSIPWTISTLDMAAALESLTAMKRLPTDPTLGWTGAGLVAASPCLGVVAGWVLMRGALRRSRRIGAVLGGALIGWAFCYFGFWLLTIGFP